MTNINLNINPYTFTGSAYIIGVIIANEMNDLEQNSIGNWLQLLGMTVLTYSSQVALVEANNKLNQDNNNQNQTNQNDELDKLKKAISRINEELDKLKNNNN